MRWIKQLGRGGYGVVHLVMVTTNSVCNLYAVKTALPKGTIVLRKECGILSQFKGYQRIVQCHGDDWIFLQDEGHYSVFLEFAPMGSLLDLQQKTYGGKIPEIDVRQFTKMILQGLSCIHRKGIVHCDLKPHNILVFAADDKDEIPELKLADFGVAKEPGEVDDGKWKHHFRGTPRYMSPESLKLGEIKPALDIWSLGCIIVEMVSGESCWPHKTTKAMWDQLVLLNETPKIPENLTRMGKDFLRKCFALKPQARWSADMLLKHPFIDHY